MIETQSKSSSKFSQMGKVLVLELNQLNSGKASPLFKELT
jgi:hypothetical protein